VTSHAVINTSPILYLARANRLDFFTFAADEIVVPNAVSKELAVGGPVEWMALAAAMGSQQLRVVDDPQVPIAIQSWDLGPGESSVLAWAYAHSPAVANIDDLAARRCATAFNIPVRGTLGLVLTAKMRGLIPAARPVIEELKQRGMHLSERVIAEALSRVGE